MLSPLEQFKIQILYAWSEKIEEINVIITNLSFTIIILFIVSLWFVCLSLKSSYILPNVRNVILEKLYEIILSMTGQIRSVVALQFYPLIVSMFCLILIFNSLGLVPYSFTVTSQLYITFTLSCSFFIGIIILGCIYNKLNFVKFFVPSAVSSKVLKYFLVCIEMLSFVIRPFSLGIRLFANMLAGHTLMYILGNFLFNVAILNLITIIIFPIGIIMLVVLLEICIALIQTYVFTILFIIYINDMFNINH